MLLAIRKDGSVLHPGDELETLKDHYYTYSFQDCVNTGARGGRVIVHQRGNGNVQRYADLFGICVVDTHDVKVVAR
jgi:hypothetical protein